jgi:predicted alpha/beta-hydrolase family hydrolase
MHDLPSKGRGVALRIVETPVGTAEVSLYPAAGAPSGLLVLGHGAGGSIDAPDLLAVAAAALAVGVSVVRVRQPYAVAGRRSPAPAAQLDVAWKAIVGALRDEAPGLPLIVGGRSSGARVACRTAADTRASGVLALAFPLHPPGHPEKSRAAELAIAQPLLVLQGARDPFGDRAEFPAHVTVFEVAGADHRLIGPGFDAAVVSAVGWLLATVAASSPSTIARSSSTPGIGSG